MNKRKINSIILELGIIAAFGMGTNIDVKAEEVLEKTTVQTTVYNAQSKEDKENAAIEKINKGNGKLIDYHLTLKIKAVTSDNLETVQAAILKAKSNKGLDLTKSEIIYYAEDAANLWDFFEILSEDNVFLSEYANLNLTGVDESNVNEFNRLLKGKRILTTKDLQKYINKVNLSIEMISKGEGTLEDYNNIEIEADVTSRNLKSINMAEKNKYKSEGSILTVSEIEQTAEDDIKEIYKCAERINEGNGNLDDYDRLGVSGVDLDNIVYANADLKERNIFVSDEIQKVIDKDKYQYSSIKNVNLGKAFLSDFKNIGCNEVNEKNLDFFNNKLKGCNYITCDEVLEAVSKKIVILNSAEIINTGKGTLEDYKNTGVLGVSEDNLSYVNREIAGKVDVSIAILQPQVDEILLSYSYVYAVNEGTEVKNGDGNVYEYYKLCHIFVPFDTKADSEFSIIRKCIEIERKINKNKFLSKSELSNLISRVDSSIEDSRVIVNKICESIEKEEAVLGRGLNGSEEKDICEFVIHQVKCAVRRISLGEGTVDDFKSFLEYKVNDYNLKTVNEDIKCYKEIQRLSDYRLSGLEEEVIKALAVYNINNDNLSQSSNKNVKEYESLGKIVSYDYKETSILRLTQDYILIKRKGNNNENLSRQAILEVLDEVENNIDKYKVILPKITYEIFTMEYNYGRELTSKEVNSVSTSIQEDMKKSVSRLVLGAGTLEDYKLFGEDSVNLNNIDAINKDIKENKELTHTSSYSLDGLSESVNKGIALYNLNEGIETADLDGDVKELKNLGVIVESSNDKTSVDKMVMNQIKEKRELNNNKVLSRSEILKIVNDVKNTSVETEKSSENSKKGMLSGIFKSIKKWVLGILGV